MLYNGNKLEIFEESERRIYYISDKWNVFSKNKSNWNINIKAKTLNKKRWYEYVRTEARNYIVHVLVAKYFIENNLNKETVNHKDWNKLNNCVENLEWMTQLENNRHAIEMWLAIKMSKNEWNIKYTNEQCIDVLLLVNEWFSYKNAWLMHWMPYSTVAHLVRWSRRKIWI